MFIKTNSNNLSELVMEADSTLKGYALPILKPFIITDFDEATYSAFSDYVAELRGDVLPIVIDSCGGEVHCLMGMLDIIKTFKDSGSRVLIYAPTKAMSCGFVLLTAGSKGLRYMGRYASAMCHEVANMELGKLTDIKNGVRETERLNGQLFDIIDENTGNAKGFWVEKITAAKNADLFLSPEESKAFGVIDVIGTPTVTIDVRYTLNVS